MAGGGHKASGGAPGARTWSPRVHCRPVPGLTAHLQAEDASAPLRRTCSPGSTVSRECALPVVALPARLALPSLPGQALGQAPGPRLRARAPSTGAQRECTDGCPARGCLCPLSGTCCSHGLELAHQSPGGLLWLTAEPP